MNFLKTLLHTEDSTTHLILRLALGIVIFPHGAQKLFGWFGGHGFSGTMGFFTDKLGFPAAIAFLVIIGESLGALGLIAGFLTRFCAAGIAVIMTGAIFKAHLANGFFMNWAGKQAGEGFEYHLLALGLAIPLILYGGGKLSADRILEEKFPDTA